MLYDNSYEIAAVVISVVIFILFMARRGYMTRSSRYFLVMLIFCFVAAVSDVVSSYTISFPHDYPMWLNYLASLLYLYSYVMVAVFFMLYTDSLTKIPALERPICIAAIVFTVYNSLVMAISPINGIIIYFDEAGNYCHGPLYYGNYVVGAAAVLMSVIMLMFGHVRFSIYQRLTSLSFSVITVASIIFQMFFPAYLLGAFGVSIALLVNYYVFENSAYNFFRDTRCFNTGAFYSIVRGRSKKGDPTGVVVGVINEIDQITKRLHTIQNENFVRVIADRLNLEFKDNIYMFSNGRFASIVKGDSYQLKEERALADRMKKALDGPAVLPDVTVDFTVSTFIIPGKHIPSLNEDLDDVINIMIRAAQDNPELDVLQMAEESIAKKHRKDNIIDAVKRALEAKSFRVFYQPIYNVETKRFESAEALVRLIDERLGFISPEEFIPITEEAGYISAVGEVVFEKVCAFIKGENFKRTGLKYIEINLSPIQCSRQDVMDKLIDTMNKYGVEPREINFEITETAEFEVSRDNSLMKNILRMSRMGITFSIDDFGSGFAATDYLLKLPVNMVKVDKSILWQAMENEDAMTVLVSTIDMVLKLHKNILVEGVETVEMVDVLKARGCRYLQGYYFSKPVPEDEFIRFIEERGN